MTLPTDPKERKAIPIYSGFIAYFPDAIAAVAQLSQKANEQHNPGQPLHWAKEKSTDEPDAGARHMIEPLMIGGSPYDSDGAAHLIKKAWRAMAELQRWLEAGNIPFAPEAPRYQFAPGDLQWRNGVDELMIGVTTLHTGKVPSICLYCGSDLDETGHTSRCLSPEANRGR